MQAEDDGDVSVRLSYEPHSGSHKGKGKQVGPFAEEVGEWLGQFFKYSSAQSHMHGHFSYPLASRESKFPLPLKTNIEGAEVDGIAFRLPSNPGGVGRVRLTQGKDQWYVEVIADRKMTFKGFTPHSDVMVLTAVINTLMEERKHD
jgi:hypothetical protein